VEKSDHERPSGDPSRVRGIEGGENVFGAVATVLRNGKHAHNNGDDTGKSPEDGKGLRFVSNRLIHSWMGGLTSSQGSHLLEVTQTMLHRSVTAKKIR